MKLLERRPEILLVGVTFLWGSTFIVTKGVVREAPPVLYATVRFCVAAGLLFLIYPRAARPGRRALAAGAVLGLGHAGGLLFQTFAQVYTTASKTAFLTALSTALIPVVGYALYRDRPRRQQLVGVTLASIGLALLTWPGADAEWNRGDLYAIASAVVYAWVIVETARRTRGADIAVITTLQIGMAALLFVLWLGGTHALLALVPLDHLPAVLALEQRPIVPDVSLLASLAWLTVICTVVTLLAQTWAISRMSATQAGVVFALEPLFATGMAIAVEGRSEWPGWRGAIGALSILAGLLIAEVRWKDARAGA